MMKDKKYYCFNEILKFIDIPYDFERAKEYPFTSGAKMGLKDGKKHA